MKKIFISYLLFIMVVLNIFLLYKYQIIRGQISKSNEFIKEDIKIKSKTIRNLKSFISYNYQYNGQTITQLSNLSFTGDKLVLFIKEGVCGSCVLELCNYMKQIGFNIGLEKIVLVGSFKERKKYDAFTSQFTNFVENMFFINDTTIFSDIDKHPVLFVLRSDSEILHFYIPDLNPDYKDIYFENIIKNHFLDN